MTVRHHNPALSQEPQNQPMKVISALPRESLLSWLENTGRFRVGDSHDVPDNKLSEDLDEILEPETYTLDSEEEDHE